MATNDDGLRAESKGTLIISLAVVFVVLSATSVILRLFTRTRILKILGADDYTIALAQVLAIAVTITTILGKHSLFSSFALQLTAACRGGMGTWTAYTICLKW